MIITRKFKVFGKASAFKKLDLQARAVNTVWNYCVDAAAHCFKHYKVPEWYYVSEDCAGTFARKARLKAVEGKYQVSYVGINRERTLHYYNPYVRGYTPEKKQQITLKGGYITGYDLQKLTAGASEMLGLSSGTVQYVCEEFEKATKTKAKLIGKGSVKSKKSYFIAYRGKRSKAWIPCKGAGLKLDPKRQTLKTPAGTFKLKLDSEIKGTLAECKFVREADGWYACLVFKDVVNEEIYSHADLPVLGVDLGLKTMISCSNGKKLELAEEPTYSVWGMSGPAVTLIPKLQSLRDRYPKTSSRRRFLEKKIQKIELAMQRWREHQHFNQAHQLLDEAKVVVVGDLSAKFIQSAFGKKSKKLSLGLFKTRMTWIATKRGQEAQFVPEHNTTKKCSSCGELTGPTGLAGLGVREWTCSNCGTLHDRDVNAAKNIANLYQLPKPELAEAAAS